MLTHANLIANAAGTATLLSESSPGDRHLSYLPLAHIYERVNVVLVRGVKGGVGWGPEGGREAVPFLGLQLPPGARSTHLLVT